MVMASGPRRMKMLVGGGKKRGEGEGEKKEGKRRLEGALFRAKPCPSGVVWTPVSRGEKLRKNRNGKKIEVHEGREKKGKGKKGADKNRKLRQNQEFNKKRKGEKKKGVKGGVLSKRALKYLLCFLTHNLEVKS